MASIASESAALSGLRPKRTMWQTFLRFMQEKPLGAAGLGIVLAFAIMAILAPYVVPKDILATNARAILASPSGEWWFGTDQFGRDLFSRTITARAYL